MIAAVIQARMSSERLPGKVLRKLGDKRTLEYVVERLEHAETIDKVIVATSVHPSDDPVAELCEQLGVPVQRGPLDDVARRYLETVERFSLEGFVRITGDSPLIDQRLVDRAVALFREGGADLVTNVFPSTFASGQSIEVVAAEAFRRGYRQMTEPDHFEHVTRYFYGTPDAWRIRNFAHDAEDEAHLDLSLDTEEDARLLESIYARMDRPHWEYSADDIVAIYREIGGREIVGPLRVGVIGLGVGERHAAAYAANPRAELAALCDIEADRLAAVSALHPGVKRTAAAEDVLDDPSIHVVSIASYDSFHFDQVRQALSNGKHVFVEKPLCLAEDEADELWRLHRQNPQLVLSSNLILRISPRFQELKRWIEAGRFGRLYYAEGDYDYGRRWKLTEGWRGELEHYSVVLGGTVHLIDLLLWLTGDRVMRVSARANRIVTEGTKFRFDDFVIATLEMESGALAKVSANFGCVHPHFHGVRIYGTEATWVNGLDTASLWTPDGEGGVERTPVESEYPGVEEGGLIESFLEAVAGGPPPVVTGDEVFRTMAVCFAIEKAAATGHAEEVKSFG